MAGLEFCSKHNMVAYLEKTDGNTEFRLIMDFLTRSSINYALTISPIVSTSFVEQFWTTAKSRTVNNTSYIDATVAGKPVNISEASIRSDLFFDDADGIDSLNNQAIFDNIQLMGNQLKDVPVPLDHFPVPTLTKKVLTFMVKNSKNFSGKDTPLFDSMLVQQTKDEGEASKRPSDSQPIPSSSPSDDQLRYSLTHLPDLHPLLIFLILFQRVLVDIRSIFQFLVIIIMDPSTSRPAVVIDNGTGYAHHLFDEMLDQNLVTFSDEMPQLFRFRRCISMDLKELQEQALQISIWVSYSPIVSTSFVEHFGTTTKSRTVNNTSYIDATVVGKPVTISEALIRSDLLFDDADGIDSLNNHAIFDTIKLMGSESTFCDQIPTNIATAGKNFSRKVTPLFDFMLVQQTEDEGEASKRPSNSQPIPSPPYPSEDQPQTQTDLSPRPSPSINVPDSNPEGYGGNHGGQSSNDASLSGNEDGQEAKEMSQTTYHTSQSLDEDKIGKEDFSKEKGGTQG
ncbi:hypothetical protein Tco_0162444, partial [Tanacetum coccineum]